MSVEQGVLLLADIGGYTNFLRQEVFTLPHAQVIVDRLMGAVVRAAGETLRFSATAGDAVLLFATPDTPLARSAVTASAFRMFEAFVNEQHRMQGLSLCQFPACQSVLDLRIKFVVSAGEILITSRGSRLDLAGPAVILAHRLLKNRVPVSEYLLSTNSFAARLTDTAWSDAYRHREDVEGFGLVDLLYLEFDRTNGYQSSVRTGSPRHAARADREPLPRATGEVLDPPGKSLRRELHTLDLGEIGE